MVYRSKPWSVAAIVLALSSVGLLKLSWEVAFPGRFLPTAWWALPGSAVVLWMGALVTGIEGFQRAQREKRIGALAAGGFAAAVVPFFALVVAATWLTD
jgi:hypothetical protein